MMQGQSLTRFAGAPFTQGSPQFPASPVQGETFNIEKPSV